jgi:hypothetical protein
MRKSLIIVMLLAGCAQVNQPQFHKPGAGDDTMAANRESMACQYQARLATASHPQATFQDGIDSNNALKQLTMQCMGLKGYYPRP